MGSRAWWLVGLCAVLTFGCSDSQLTGTSDTGSSGGTGTTGIPPPATSYARSDAPNPIVAENQKPGDWDWYITKESPNREIEGYTSDVSTEAGETLDFMISTSVESDYTYAVYRFGYYGGTGARKVAEGPTLHAKPGAECPVDAATQLVECDWPVGFSLTIPSDWVSGAYFVKLHRADGFERYVPFIVRDHRKAEVLFKAAVDTDQAYNRWGGESLYYDSSHRSPSGMGFKVSFDRPFDDGAGMYSMLWWEQHAIRFLERNGYDVSYGTNVDANRFKGFFDGIGAIVTAGHDEYWSQRERDVVDQVLASGQTSLVNMTANAGYWRIRYEPDAHGNPWRNIVCYKAKQDIDPLGSGAQTTTAMFRSEPNAQPENGLFGTMYEDWALMGFPLRIGDVSNPLFKDTGFVPGDVVPQIVGYEYDKVFDNGATPPGTTVLASSPLLNAEGFPSTAQVVVRETPQGRTVFSAGSIYWPLALSEQPNLEDTRVWKLTWNVMEQALSHRHTPRPPPDFGLVTHDDPPPVARYASSIAAVAGKAGLLKVVDGPVAQAGFAAPTGLAVASDGTIYVSDSTARVIRMVKNGQVTTIAGDGVDGSRDGPGLQARFRLPAGMAIGPDGALYVADAEVMAIRRIDLSSPTHEVTTYAGDDSVYAGFADGPGDQAHFNRPTSIAFGKSGELYVVDEENNLIRKVANDAAHTVTTFAGTWSGYEDGPLLQAAFNFPTGITSAPDGTLYILDSGNALIRRIKPGSGTVETVAGTQGIFGCVDGPGDQAELRGQMGILWMPSGVIFTDASSNKVRQVEPGADPASSTLTTFAGDGRTGANLSTPAESNIVAPAGLAVGPDGKVYVTDTGNGVVRVLTP